MFVLLFKVQSDAAILRLPTFQHVRIKDVTSSLQLTLLLLNHFYGTLRLVTDRGV